jgi:DnaJ-class molecular chaperone
MGTLKVSKREVMGRFRGLLRDVHPDHGGDEVTASAEIEKIREARRILLP